MKSCNSCGKCCIKYSNGQLSAEPSEIEYWDEHRPDIAAYTQEGKIWIDPSTGNRLTVCPFLKKQPSASSSSTVYHCDIYYDRPNDCKLYPSTLEEMIRDDCEMIEGKDRKNPKQAQNQLNLIMSDSWQSCIH